MIFPPGWSVLDLDYKPFVCSAVMLSYSPGHRTGRLGSFVPDLDVDAAGPFIS